MLCASPVLSHLSQLLKLRQNINSLRLTLKIVSSLPPKPKIRTCYVIVMLAFVIVMTINNLEFYLLLIPECLDELKGFKGGVWTTIEVRNVLTFFFFSNTLRQCSRF